ncbi:MAG: type IV conjugative transfer system coupling protein TraD [Gammaproteobacteria bacterium]|nr:type IV conjugative transfer system coupling protein TraD [Gammaproteobacteria bacterium]
MQNQLNNDHDTKAKYFTRGGQITFHNWRMLFQINGEIIKLYFISLIALSIVSIYAITPRDVLTTTFYYWYSKFELALYRIHLPMKIFTVNYHGKNYIENGLSFLSQWQFVATYQEIYGYALIGFLISLIVSFGICFIFVKWLTKRGKDQASSKFIRGIALEDSNVVAKTIVKNNMASDLTIDGFPLIKNAEVQHMLVHGTTGTGKGQTLQKLLDCIRKRGDRVILYDKGCSFTPVYYREGKDILLNPFDTRCANWDMWKEAITATDFENMAESLIPLHGETDPFWVNAARTIFSSVAYKMKDDSDRSIDKLLQVILTSELSDLETYLKGTEAATLASDKIEKTAISIRSVISTYLKSLRFLKELDNKNNKFSIRDWIRDETVGDQWLIISSNAEQHLSLRPLISMWLAQASISLLGLQENPDRRIWFIVDELPSLHKLPQLPETIAEVRKFGGCFVLGMQSFAQLETTYGRNAAREIFDLLNTRFFFRNPSADMANIASHELGEEETEEMRENYSYGANRVRDGISIGRQKTKQPIVTYSEIMGLPDMQCFLRLSSNYPVTKLTLKYEKREAIAPYFMERKSKTLKETASTKEDSDENTDTEIFYSRKKDYKKHTVKKMHDVSKNNVGITFE